jgi:hypothetical protein
MCANNDFSLLSANTGIATISVANQSLIGDDAVEIITGAGNGTIIKSVTIKAITPTTTGMVRLFIGTGDGSSKSLYKEIPIPTNPVLQATPTPALILPMFETVLEGGFKLKSGYKLYASTQNAEKFNIIAEGVNWNYADVPVPPAHPLPCCTYLRETANTGLGIVNTANSKLEGGGAVVPIFEADSTTNGSSIMNITIKALQSTHLGMIRLFINDGVNNYLYKEILIPETTQSSNMPAFKHVIESGLKLQAGYKIVASTEISEPFALTVEAADWIYV